MIHEATCWFIQHFFFFLRGLRPYWKNINGDMCGESTLSLPSGGVMCKINVFLSRSCTMTPTVISEWNKQRLESTNYLSFCATALCCIDAVTCTSLRSHLQLGLTRERQHPSL